MSARTKVEPEFFIGPDGQYQRNLRAPKTRELVITERAKRNGGPYYTHDNGRTFFVDQLHKRAGR